MYSISFVMPYEQWPSEDFLDGNPRAITLAGPETDEKKVLQIVNKNRRYHLGLPVSSENMPTTWQWKTSKPLLDCDKPFGFPCINGQMKSVIEGLEPGVHQFFPIQVVDKQKQPLAKRWLWNVCNRIDSMDREHTTYIQYHGKRWSYPKTAPSGGKAGRSDPSAKPKFVVGLERVGAAHFWRDPNILANPIFCSKAAGDALRAEDFSGLGLLAWESV